MLSINGISISEIKKSRGDLFWEKKLKLFLQAEKMLVRKRLVNPY